MMLTAGARLGPYTITAEIGHDGMGVVYTAHDPRLKRQVAIKLLTADLTRNETAKRRIRGMKQCPSRIICRHVWARSPRPAPVPVRKDDQR